jgi:choline monooxygenase
MPEFDGVEDFPSATDNLHRLSLERWGPLLFTAIDPAFGFDRWIEPVLRRTAFLDLEALRFDAAGARDYTIEANWALYVDNYLEEFHIPYVHAASLGDKVDYGAYRTELFEWGNLQLGFARQGEDTFDLPDDHPEAGATLGGLYFWLFPNLMLNFYPWGVSVNVVRPLGPSLTRVSFLPYVLDPARRAKGVGGDLHRVEMEDEEVVESVQRGVRSRLYDRGRYSPRREVGTWHFHRLLADFMAA